MPAQAGIQGHEAPCLPPLGPPLPRGRREKQDGNYASNSERLRIVPEAESADLACIWYLPVEGMVEDRPLLRRQRLVERLDRWLSGL
jgi:hypothetical protein